MGKGHLWHPETMAVAAGRDEAPGAALNVPPTFASTYRDGGPIAYGRFGNPTWSAFEEAIGSLEGGSAVSFSSGQAAAMALFEAVDSGGRVVFPDGCYIGIRSLLHELESSGRLRLSEVDVTDTEAVCRSLEGAALVWLESPTNPLLGVADLPRILAAARKEGVTSVVDNTFATPVVQRPLGWGADAVVHSASKYIGGHSDLLLGVVVTRDGERRSRLIDQRTKAGATPGVMEAYLALRGLRTLPVRFARQQQSAMSLARRLAAHRAVVSVRYPGLSTDPFHERAAAQMDGFGAIVSFELASAQQADGVIGAVQLMVPATSLGGVETTIERRNRWPGEEAVPAGLLRMSVGLEHPEDLWADLQAALDSVCPTG
jgi:cystathionine gamma-synthase